MTKCTLRTPSAYPRQNALARALREIGCLERTLFILDWIFGVLPK
jgi:TnpA family transposase